MLSRPIDMHVGASCWLSGGPVYASPACVPIFSLFLYSESLSLVQEPFQLATEKRAKERQEMEKKMAEAEAQRVQKLEEVRQQEEEQQKEELARLRKELVTGQQEC